MKQVFLTFTALLFFCSNLFAQWEVLNEGVKGNLNAMDFINVNVGWVAGDEGTLLKTEDGGDTWRSLPQAENWNVRIMDFITDSVGWVVSNDWSTNKEVFMRTTDGGQTWQVQKENTNIVSLCVIDENMVYVLITGDPYRYAILKTSNGGVNWEYIYLNYENKHFNTICFVNRDTGFVVGSFWDGSINHALVLRTENGGMTWTEIISPTLGAISNIQFIHDSTGFFLDEYSFLLYKTEDAFKTWPTSPIIDTTYIFSYYALNRDTICAVVQEGGVGNWGAGCNLQKSVNGGQTWENKFFINWWVDKVYFSSSQTGFLFGGAPYGGTIVRSIDAGENWKFQLLSFPFHDVSFINKDIGLACGGLDEVHFTNGNILVTHDSGKSWEVCLSTPIVRTCLLVNDQVGFASIDTIGFRGSSSIFKTEDSGKSWIDNYAFSGADMFFIDDKTGWAVGGYQEGDTYKNGIIMTNDQGENWELFWEPPTALYSIFFIDSTTGWAVGWNGLLVKYTDSLQWHVLSKTTNLPLNKIFFVDENTGFIAGGYLNWDGEFQAVLFKTTNGGESWQAIPDLPYLIHDIYFSDPLLGWAVGTDKNRSGVILLTIDGGDHWTVQEEGLIGQLKALSYRDGFLWAVGDYGLVLRLDVATAIEDNSNKIVPVEFKLFQNYPNPFNAKTFISYQLSVISGVELSVYNILGQKVATLISEKQPAGSYKVEWDASGFASGIYLYQLKTKDITITKKLVLLR